MDRRRLPFRALTLVKCLLSLRLPVYKFRFIVQITCQPTLYTAVTKNFQMNCKLKVLVCDTVSSPIYSKHISLNKFDFQIVVQKRCSQIGNSVNHAEVCCRTSGCPAGVFLLWFCIDHRQLRLINTNKRSFVGSVLIQLNAFDF